MILLYRNEWFILQTWANWELTSRSIDVWVRDREPHTLPSPKKTYVNETGYRKGGVKFD